MLHIRVSPLKISHHQNIFHRRGRFRALHEHIRRPCPCDLARGLGVDVQARTVLQTRQGRVEFSVPRFKRNKLHFYAWASYNTVYTLSHRLTGGSIFFLNITQTRCRLRFAGRYVTANCDIPFAVSASELTASRRPIKHALFIEDRPCRIASFLRPVHKYAPFMASGAFVVLSAMWEHNSISCKVVLSHHLSNLSAANSLSPVQWGR